MDSFENDIWSPVDFRLIMPIHRDASIGKDTNPYTQGQYMTFYSEGKSRYTRKELITSTIRFMMWIHRRKIGAHVDLYKKGSVIDVGFIGTIHAEKNMKLLYRNLRNISMAEGVYIDIEYSDLMEFINKTYYKENGNIYTKCQIEQYRN